MIRDHNTFLAIRIELDALYQQAAADAFTAIEMGVEW